jgi:spore coat protein U-like protein
VQLSCEVTTTALSFGNYDPIAAHAASALTGTGGLTVTCTDSLPATVTLDQGLYPAAGSTDAAPLRRMSDGAGHSLSYQLYQDAALSTVWGNTPETGMCASGSLTVYGAIPAAQNAPVGSYADTVVVVVCI